MTIFIRSQLALLRVSKHNELITSHFTFSLNEYRVILYGISLINPTDPEFPRSYRINIKRFCEIFNVPATNIYKDIKDAILNKMFNRRITIDSEDLEDAKKRFPLIDEVDYSDNNCEVIITFHKRVQPFLHQLQSHFTSYYLEQVAHFKSAYSIRFYEFALMELKKRSGKPTYFFLTIEEIKGRLELESKYKLYSDLKRRIIEKAISEINTFSDIQLCYTEIKAGRSVKQLRFTVKYTKWAKSEKQYTLNYDPELKVS